ncbi:MAG TPA: porin [Planctomycetota bacterium]|nr:porin [Planctomycetota bacterium]
MRRIPIALLLLAAATAAADEDAALRERLAAAERRIQKLEEEAAAKDRATLETAVEEYLAEHPPSGAPGEDLAGYGPVPIRNGCGCSATQEMGFFLRDASGDFLLRLSGQLQIRYAINAQDDSLGDPTLAGFEIPRAKLVASGNVFGPHWSYKLQGNFDSFGGQFTLEDAWITWYGGNWSITAGQFKCPALREEAVDSAYQLLVERSVVNDALTSGERLQGVSVGYIREAWKASVSFTDGDGSANTPVLMGDTDYAVTLRGELLVKGSFDTFVDFTSFRGDEPGILLGINAHFQGGETGTPGQGTDAALLSFDASFEFGGANLFLEGIFMDVDEGGVGGTRNPFGFVVHGGYFVTEKLEIVARYEYADLDPLVPPDTVNILTAGANYYFHRQRVKLTADFGYAFDAVPVTQKYTDYRRDTTFATGQIVFRIQLQLLF